MYRNQEFISFGFGFGKWDETALARLDACHGSKGDGDICFCVCNVSRSVFGFVQLKTKGLSSIAKFSAALPVASAFIIWAGPLVSFVFSVFCGYLFWPENALNPEMRHWKQSRLQANRSYGGSVPPRDSLGWGYAFWDFVAVPTGLIQWLCNLIWVQWGYEI